MKAFLTGEAGFIAKNLVRVAGDRIHFIDIEPGVWMTNEKGEIDFTNHVAIGVLKEKLHQHGCNVIIHNGATVGTDVCGLYPKHAILNNV